ncbi:hypothetical protein [Streptomyces sp. NPDC050485]|uniref:hypothetical protein n=1 Tax=Streptomyces sp. NPDC050485 TaxID=3365617 RepID=UPI003796B505
MTHCPAALPLDLTPVTVTVLDAGNTGADGCELHAARLLTLLNRGRVFALPDAPAGAAHRVFRAAAPRSAHFDRLADVAATRPSTPA